MAEIARHRGGQEGDRVGQVQAHPLAQQQQDADVDGRGGTPDHAVAQHAVEQGFMRIVGGVVAALQQYQSTARPAVHSV